MEQKTTSCLRSIFKKNMKETYLKESSIQLLISLIDSPHSLNIFGMRLQNKAHL